MNQLRIAIHVRLEADAELRAGAEEVEFLEFEARAVGAAFAAEGDAGVESPDVLRRDFQVDHAVVKCHGTDERIAQVARVAQDAGRLFDEPRPVQIAALEQQLVFDGRLARGDVQLVAESRQRRVFVGGFGIEQIALVEADLADARALPLQLLVGWQIFERARGSGFGARALTLGSTFACA